MHKKKTGLENKLTKSSRGGKRINSGRKKAEYETKTIAFRVRVEFVEPIKKMVKDYISQRLQGDADKSLDYLDFNSNIKAGQEAIELLKELRGFAPYCTDHRQRVDDILSKVSVDMEVSQNEA